MTKDLRATARLRLSEFDDLSVAATARRALQVKDDSHFWLIAGLLAGKLPTGHPAIGRMWEASRVPDRSTAERECELLTAFEVPS
jgi:hypothetical protein